MQAQDRGLRETLLLRDRGRERVSQARDTIAPLAGQILTRARESGWSAAGPVRHDAHAGAAAGCRAVRDGDGLAALLNRSVPP